VQVQLEEDNKALDRYVSSRSANTEDMENIVNKFSDASKTACNKSFKTGTALMLRGGQVFYRL
jgi:nitrogen fixation/metabolism regulation signal transduction histidine kinase